ncbi:MAG: hypothetical protein AMXMBFR72_13760 [Betaproteobacteria bacterium]
MRAATILSPAASKRARIRPIAFLATASGLMMERVLSMAMLLCVLVDVRSRPASRAFAALGRRARAVAPPGTCRDPKKLDK